MKTFIFGLVIFGMATSAVASSGQWYREIIQTSTEFAVAQEKLVFMADEVQVMDSYNEGSTTFVTVGPEKDGRAARSYNCWVTKYAPEVGDDTVITRTRLNNRACRAL